MPPGAWARPSLPCPARAAATRRRVGEPTTEPSAVDAAMEFVVLKVNGRDVSPHEAARALRASDDPLVVTLKRMKLAGTPPPAAASSPPSPSGTTSGTTATPTTPSATVAAYATASVEVQTDDLWSDWAAEDADGAPERSLHDILEQDIDLEEVTLVRSEVEETLGITLSCSCSSGSDDLDTEVYIAAVEPSSLAGRDGRLQRGDQILQVNGEDVTTRELAEHMFNSPANSITLLVSRYFSEDEPDDEELESCPRPSCGKPIKPRTPTHAKQFHSGRDTPDDGSTDRRSDGSSDRRSDGSTDRRSDTSTDRRSDCSDTTATTAYINVQPAAAPGVVAKAPANGPPSGTPTSASVRRKESSKRPAGDDSNNAPAPPGSAVASRRSQRTLPPTGAANGGPPGSRSTTRSLPGSLPGVAAHPLRAPSSEHIYETIPESDSEHIYCEPYEPTAEYTNVVNGQPPRPLLTLQLRNGREDRATLRLGPTAASQASPSGRQSGGSSSGPCSTMYTNAANLQHTIEVQQELFRQSLRQTTPTSSSRPPLPLPSPSSASRHRGLTFPQPPVCPFPPPPPPVPAAPAPSDAKMEWKVKRRADGSRYITRRPVRTRVIREALRDRAAQLRDERAGFSTEDDTASELKMGRYWTKAERKQHVRRRRQQQVTLDALEQPKQSLHVEEDGARRQGAAADPQHAQQPGHKKTARKKSNLSNVDDFKTVQELLAQGSRATVNAKMLGLLSVTTV
ncbi:PDZ domain-containing RING finger protein 4 [Thrips palmi]|uniref:PDZ domain-containing RING finger protein 4 n=1 Tax=Thrips palmi TaxID=161013 RepID=A0A6P8YMI6_THRPL|nr:PDZ domain-containing RING finger protein 4 [Thrips palmi]